MRSFGVGLVAIQFEKIRLVKGLCLGGQISNPSPSPPGTAALSILSGGPSWQRPSGGCRYRGRSSKRRNIFEDLATGRRRGEIAAKWLGHAARAGQHGDYECRWADDGSGRGCNRERGGPAPQSPPADDVSLPPWRRRRHGLCSRCALREKRFQICAKTISAQPLTRYRGRDHP